MFMISPSRSRWWFCFGACAVLGLSGCVTTRQEQARLEAERREDHLIMMQEVRKLEGRLEGVEMEVQGVNRAVDGVSRTAAQDARVESESLRAAIKSLESRVGALESARARDREEIIDHLTRKITQVMSTQGSARSSASTRRSTSEYGYEHVVQPGENLSRIAAAYGVSMKAIIQANNLKNPDQLQKDQVLFIPE
jgi:hypothetical protein